ncbi:MAG: T9SS type A sorting domain-containing protein [Crocinitomicaceae bacterium]
MKKLFAFLILLSPFLMFGQNWSPIGPEGGYFKDFEIHPTNPDIVFAGSDDGGGLYKSTDAGASWELKTADFPNFTCWKITFDKNQPDTIYACDVYSRYGLLKSVDGGETWSLSNTGLISQYDKMVSGLAIKTADTLFISTGEAAASTPPRPGNGIFRSYDGGANWEAAGLQGLTFPCIDNNVFGTIFAGSEGNGLYFSNDNGDTWANHPDISLTNTIHEIQINENVMILASSEGVFLSTDWGITLTYIGLNGEFNFDACIHKTAPDIEIYSSTLSDLMYYTSATGSWTTMASPFFTDQIVIGITSDGTNLYCSGFSNSPIMKSSDAGLSWSETASSPIATEVNDIYLDPNDDNRMFAVLMGTYNLNGLYDRECIYETNDGGMTWTRKGPDAHGLCITANPQDDNTFYLGSFAQGVYKTTDNFDTFTQLSLNGKTVVDVIVSPADTSVVLISEIDFNLSEFRIKRSEDGGAVFDSVSAIIANGLAFNPGDNDTVYAATNDGVELSGDFGLSFFPWMLSGEDCLTLKAEGSDLYVGTADGKLFKISNGISTEITGPWTTPVELKSILIEDDHLFVGLSGAEKDTTYDLHGSIWRSDDDGSSWTDITTDMISTNIYGKNIIETNGHELFLATYGGGVYKSSGLDLSASINEAVSSKNLIYPNPANDRIYVSLDEFIGSNYKLTNVNGENIKQGVVSNEGISLSGLSEGVYFIKINGSEIKFIKN